MKNKLVVASTLSVTLASLSFNSYGMNLSVRSLDSSSKIKKEKIDINKSDMSSFDSSFLSESGAVSNIDTEEGKEKLHKILDKGHSSFSDIRDDEMSSDYNSSSSSDLSLNQDENSSLNLNVVDQQEALRLQRENDIAERSAAQIYPKDLEKIESVIEVENGESVALVETSGESFSCGFRALTLDRETVAGPRDRVRKNIINKLVQGIRGKIPGVDRNEVMRLMIPQLQYYLSSGGFVGWGLSEGDLDDVAWPLVYDAFQKEIRFKSLQKPFVLKSGQVVTVLGTKEVFDQVNTEADNNISDIVDGIRNKLLIDNAFIQSLELTQEERQIVLSDDEVFSIFKIVYPESQMDGLDKNSFKKAKSLMVAADQIYAMNSALSKEEIQKKIAILKVSKGQILDWVKAYNKETELREDLNGIKKNEATLEDLYSLPLTCQSYFKHYVGQRWRMLEMTNVEQTGIWDAIAYVQKANLKLFADIDFDLNYAHFKKGQLIHYFESPNAEVEIYAFMQEGHYSKGLPKRYLSPGMLPKRVRMIVYPPQMTANQFPGLDSLDDLVGNLTDPIMY